jgi:uncharacterized protein (TIGR03086 family)
MPRAYGVTMHEVELLTDILDKTGDVIAAVDVDQTTLPTPCEEYDVATLINHIVGWIQVFDAGSNERIFEGDASAYRCGPDPAAEFRSAAAGVIAGWQTHGLDRQVRVMGGDEMPGEMVFNMTLMEYLTHGWDLATATAQKPPYTEAEATETLTRAEGTLPPQYRGGDMPFGPPVPIGADAPPLDRFIAFMGRQPS